ncbi:SOS response-associated peptidase [Aeromicrobium wangtongii]|uniref:SOS response-associated peptidase n=1 Tax=Aeromicrobium wangtongii TaxID=2969247 RepID=UPI00201832CE|nr:SOS response-associated peptidase [Aeromicrobium wangtongii]MCL3820070.1 SOS response-associated peptidase [Aeromicrobium wangtongii]
MCGRYATTQTSSTLSRVFETDLANSFVELEADYNMAPTKLAPVVIGRREAPSAPAVHRELLTARWGLIPSWAKDPSIGNRMINARSETVAEKPAFKKAFAKRRALVPADGYYEWYAGVPQEGRKKPVKQPFYITPKDGSVLAMAGLYEFWKDREADEWVVSYTILTTTAEDDLGHIHERMPMFLPPDAYDAWLDPAPRATDELLDLLIPAAPGRLAAYPVSTAVNNVRNNGPELIAPLPAE